AVCITSLVACSKTSNKCDKDELPASIESVIANTRNCTCLPYINLYTWKGNNVYMQYIKGPTCNGVPVYYDKDGNNITMAQGYTIDQFLDESTFIKEVWHCSVNK